LARVQCSPAQHNFERPRDQVAGGKIPERFQLSLDDVRGFAATLAVAADPAAFVRAKRGTQWQCHLEFNVPGHGWRQVIGDVLIKGLIYFFTPTRQTLKKPLIPSETLRKAEKGLEKVYKKKMIVPEKSPFDFYKTATPATGAPYYFSTDIKEGHTSSNLSIFAKYGIPLWALYFDREPSLKSVAISIQQKHMMIYFCKLATVV